MSLIDDAVNCGARIHSNPLVPQVILDGTELARLRAMWLEEFRERAVQVCEQQHDRARSPAAAVRALACAERIRALPLDKGTR